MDDNPYTAPSDERTRSDPQEKRFGKGNCLFVVLGVTIVGCVLTAMAILLSAPMPRPPTWRELAQFAAVCVPLLLFGGLVIVHGLLRNQLTIGFIVAVLTIFCLGIGALMAIV